MEAKSGPDKAPIKGFVIAKLISLASDCAAGGIGTFDEDIDMDYGSNVPRTCEAVERCGLHASSETFISEKMHFFKTIIPIPKTVAQIKKRLRDGNKS
jgi:hypothetical protein